MIEPAYQELADQLAQALVAVGFIPSGDKLKIDPEAPFTPTGDERTLVCAAALVKLGTAPVRHILGGAAPRYVVERQCRLELAAAGPARLMRSFRVNDVLNAVAAIPGRNPTLSGRAERLILGEQTDDELPPNGVSLFLTFTIRVRSGDALGRTP